MSVEQLPVQVWYLQMKLPALWRYLIFERSLVGPQQQVFSTFDFFILRGSKVASFSNKIAST